MKKVSLLLISIMLLLIFFGCGMHENETGESTQSVSGNMNHTHSMTYYEATNATCTQKGNVEYYSCSTCNKCFSDELGQIEISADSIEIAITECAYNDSYSTDFENHWYQTTCKHAKIKDKNIHTFDEGTVTTESTCTLEGVKTYTCTECAYKKTESLPLSEEHSYQADWSQDDVYHWYAPTCPHGELIKEKVIHIFDDNLRCTTCKYQTEYSTTGLRYTLNEEGTGYEVGVTSSFTDLYCIIPEYYENLPVVKINKINSKNFIGIKIPKTCKEFGGLERCNSLISMIIPEGVEAIGSISECDNLEYIYVPSSLDDLKFLSIYDNNKIKEMSFYYYPSLYGKNSRAVHAYIISNNEFITVTCRDESNVRGYQHVKVASSLKKIIISNGEIPENAFSGISMVSEIVLPKNLQKIEPYTFENCASLETLIIPEGVTEIGEYAFKNCTSLKEIVIPNSVKTISANAFAGCSALEKIEIPNSVITVGEFAFLNCSSLSSITFGSCVNTIGRGVLNGCSSLQSITVSEENTTFKAIENCLIQNKKLIAGGNGCAIPSDGTVTIIGENAFTGQNGLTSIIIPDAITTIEKSAFSNCANLESVTIGKGVSSIANSAFYWSENIKFTVSKENNYYYQNGTSLVKKSNNTSVSTDELYYREGDFIYFGEYPQSIKADNVTISGSADSNGYFWGNDGERYAKVASSFGNIYFSNGLTSESEATYYFKVEPIKWKIIKEENGKAMLFCTVTLDESIYCEEKDGTFAHYTTSEVRSWLNETFYNTAFCELQQKLIIRTLCENGPVGDNIEVYDEPDTYDYVFLPSVYELIKAAGHDADVEGVYGTFLTDGDVIPMASDYYCSLYGGNSIGIPNVVSVWLRNAQSGCYNTAFWFSGEISAGLGMCDSSLGVAPCVWINL